VGGRDCPDGTPVAVEKKVDGDFEGYRISGRIDRVDIRENRKVLLDYKTGKVRSARQIQAEMDLGQNVQAVLYPYLYHQHKASESVPDFAYIFLSGPKETPAARVDPVTLLRQWVELLNNGAFVPTPNALWDHWAYRDVRPCRYCGLTSLCRRLDRGATLRYGRLLKSLAPLRFTAVQNEGSAE
jgi:hypothetical protein